MSFRVGRCLLRDLLRERGITQQQLADRLDMKTQQVSNYVTGQKQMSLKTAKAFAVALKCNIDDLYEFIPVHKKTGSRQ